MIVCAPMSCMTPGEKLLLGTVYCTLRICKGLSPSSNGVTRKHSLYSTQPSAWPMDQRGPRVDCSPKEAMRTHMSTFSLMGLPE